MKQINFQRILSGIQSVMNKKDSRQAEKVSQQLEKHSQSEKTSISKKTGDNNAIPLLCVLLVMSGTEVILIITILITVILILSFPYPNGTGMIRCNITNVEAVVCSFIVENFSLSHIKV